MEKNLPKISYCVFTYNEEKNIYDCLFSIFSQKYPKDKLEVILVDDDSTDKTLEIAKNFPLKIFRNGKHDGDLSATIGFTNATGDFFTAIGADMRFRGDRWFLKMIKPLIENPDLPAVFTRYYSHPKESIITRYLNLDPIQRDLVYQTFSIGFDKVIAQKKSGYYICEYKIDKMPPQTHGLYRIKPMRKIVEDQKVYYDMGNIVALVKAGYTKFGYVPNAGYYHFHAESMRHLLKKRMRNIQRSYLRYKKMSSTKKNQYTWINFNSVKDIAKLALLIISANLLFPLFFLSIIKALKNRNRLYLLDAPVTFLLVDTILFTFLKERNGREFIKKTFKSFFWQKKPTSLTSKSWNC